MLTQVAREQTHKNLDTLRDEASKIERAQVTLTCGLIADVIERLDPLAVGIAVSASEERLGNGELQFLEAYDALGKPIDLSDKIIEDLVEGELRDLLFSLNIANLYLWDEATTEIPTEFRAYEYGCEAALGLNGLWKVASKP